MNPFVIILIVLLVIILAGGVHGVRSGWLTPYPSYGVSALGIILIVLLILLLAGYL